MNSAAVPWRREAATRAWAGLVILAIVLLDQIVKTLVVARFELGERVPVISGLFDLTYTLNPGGVWGLGRDLAMLPRTIVFLALPVAITALAIYYAWCLPAADRFRHAAIALVIGGAIGNLIDRLRLDPPAVIDFLLFQGAVPGICDKVATKQAVPVRSNISRNDKANFDLYTTGYTMPELLYSDWVQPPKEVQPLMALVQKLAP